jgi:NitT/TauT family transport system substrate-binding protein
MKGGAVILPAVQKGDLHIGFTNVVSVVALNAKRDRTDPTFVVCFVGATYERKGHTNHALLCRKDAKLELADLNKPEIKFAVNTTRNIEELMLRRYLAAKGLQVKTLNLVPISFPEMLKALERDEVQVASIVEPFIEPALRTGKYRCIAKQYQEVAPDTIVATYAVTQKWLKENRDIAIKFARAFEKANSFINTDDVEARQIIGSYTRIGKEDLPIIGLPAFEMKIKPESLSELIDEMIQYSFIDKNYNLKPEDMIAPPQGE